MAAPKGHPKWGGRKPGQPNNVTIAAKEAFRLAFEGLGGVPKLISWATENETEFFRLYARLIPVEHANADDKPFALTVTWKQPSD